MDVGTAYEMGYMRGLGRPVFGYSNQTPLLAERTERYNATLGPESIDPYTAGTEIEKFDLFENLMIGIAVRNLSCDVVLREVPIGEELTNLSGFEICVEMAASALRGDSRVAT